jgi:hypothetical protein
MNERKINPWRLFVGAMIPNWLLEREEVSQGAKLAYARLSQFAGKKGYCWPKLDTIAASIGVKTRQAQSYIAELREHKLLYVRESTDGKSPNKFFFLDHSWMHDDVSEDPDDSESIADEEVFPRGAEDCTPRVQDNAPQGCRILRTEENQGEESHGSDSGDALAPLAASAPPGDQRIPQPQTAEPNPIARANRDATPPPPFEEPQRREGRHPGHAKPPRQAKPRWLQEPVDDSGEEPPTRNDRKAVSESPDRTPEGLRKLVEEQSARSKQHAEEQLQKLRKREQMSDNLQGKVRPPGKRQLLKQLENTWQELMAEKFPSVRLAAWGPKEFGQTSDLVEKYSGTDIDHALHYVVEQWDSIQARLLKNKGTFPTVGFLLRFHSVIVPEAQTWITFKNYKKQVDEFYIAHPTEPYPPTELDNAYQEARKAIERMGLKT